ncbi:peptidoglycan bridge formation glycyltransferase FemA/FemB family protein [candidate division WWE3 bacterium]|nr:peptidoglycan bridge formation glycyltransferase FemA/FemB family protein [candidate division WWE3 bacterium]
MAASNSSSPASPYPLDLRQSKEWGQYLEFLGWQIFTTSNGVRYAVMQDRLGNVVKVQRPRGVTPVDLQEIEEKAQELGSALIKVEPDLSQDLEVFKKEGYVKNMSPLCPPSTLFIDLRKSEKELYADLSGSCKYSIRRAYREGAQVEFFVNPKGEILEKFFKIHKSTGKQKSFYTQGFDDISKKVEVFGDQAVLGVVSSPLEEGGDPVATGANLYLGFGKGVWYMHGGTTEEGRNTRNGYVLYWELILHLKKLGYEWLDFEGVDDKRFPSFTRNWGGLSHFKEKFGGGRVEFPAPRVKYLKPILKKLSKFIDLPV